MKWNKLSHRKWEILCQLCSNLPVSNHTPHTTLQNQKWSSAGHTGHSASTNSLNQHVLLLVPRPSLFPHNSANFPLKIFTQGVVGTWNKLPESYSYTARKYVLWHSLPMPIKCAASTLVPPEGSKAGKITVLKGIWTGSWIRKV